MLQKIRIVLVETSHPGNIGAAARAMKNMGLSRLFLVNPANFPSSVAQARAAGADDVLANAKIYSTLKEALQGCSLVLGTSARDRRIPWPLLNPQQAATMSIEQAQAGEEIGMVFGREQAGLTNSELQCCHQQVRIPCDPDFGSLNLAAAVQVVTYELRNAYLHHLSAGTNTGETTNPITEQLATHDELEAYYRHLEHTLITVGFLDPLKPRHLMTRLRRLYNRSTVSKLEINILRGILTETQKSLDKAPQK